MLNRLALTYKIGAPILITIKNAALRVKVNRNYWDFKNIFCSHLLNFEMTLLKDYLQLNTCTDIGKKKKKKEKKYMFKLFPIKTLFDFLPRLFLSYRR